jgi:hypothetical protein
MRIVIESTLPVEELAAEPATLARLQLLLDRARRAPVHGRLLPGGLLALPMVADRSVPPLTVLLRPYSATSIGPTP